MSPLMVICSTMFRIASRGIYGRSPKRSALLIDMIALDYPQAQRLSDKDYWDLSLLDEIEQSGPSSQEHRKG